MMTPPADQNEKMIEDEEMIEDGSFLEKLGLDEDELSYAKYQWEQSEKEDRKRGLA